MPDDPLSDEVNAFIRVHIRSVGQMEILALMCTQPDREWTPREVDAVLRSNHQLIAGRLAEFVRSGVLVKAERADEAYRFQPASPALRAAAAETVHAFQTRPVLVIETIFRPEADPGQTFADAFRFRPK
jgi:hypothetical protein